MGNWITENWMWIAIALAVLWLLAKYNGLIRARNIMRESHGVICVFLQQRFDLIPNLMNVVKGYIEHEKETLAEITQLRSTAMTDMKSANQLNSKMMDMIAVAEAQPTLKASEQFVKLQQSISKMENQLQAARRAYNMSVTDLNNRIEMFPSSIFAKMFNFQKGDLFESAEIARENVKVNFNITKNCPSCNATITSNDAPNCEYCGMPL